MKRRLERCDRVVWLDDRVGIAAYRPPKKRGDRGLGAVRVGRAQGRQQDVGHVEPRPARPEGDARDKSDQAAGHSGADQERSPSGARAEHHQRGIELQRRRRAGERPREGRAPLDGNQAAAGEQQDKTADLAGVDLRVQRRAVERNGPEDGALQRHSGDIPLYEQKPDHRRGGVGHGPRRYLPRAGQERKRRGEHRGGRGTDETGHRHESRLRQVPGRVGVDGSGVG